MYKKKLSISATDWTFGCVFSQFSVWMIACCGVAPAALLNWANIIPVESKVFSTSASEAEDVVPDGPVGCEALQLAKRIAIMLSARGLNDLIIVLFRDINFLHTGMELNHS